ncbi:hypothetical protein BH11ACT2_BH11ACT2_05020 [soil metagenome]
MGSRVAVIGVIASLAFLAGCASAPVDPLGDQLRAAVRQDRVDRAWAEVALEYPEAIRPTIAVGPVLDDAAWATATTKCFADEGFVVVRQAAGFQYSSSQGQSPLQFAVARFHCAIAVPSLDEVAGYLDTHQLGALYDHFISRVQPCLALSGVATAKPPLRSRFTAGAGTALWTPFIVQNSAVAAGKTDGRRLAELEKLCPPIPAWLHL